MEINIFIGKLKLIETKREFIASLCAYIEEMHINYTW
jgi:hypothetical protein